MSATMPDPPHDEADLMAAEYVLGVLDAAGLRQARRRLRVEPAFVHQVDAWERALVPWLADLAPVAAPADAWPRIRRALGLAAGDRTPEPPKRPAGAPGAGPWRGLALGGFALAAACALALVAVLRRPPEVAPAPPPVVRTEVVQPDMVASIAADDGRAMLVAGIDSRSGAMVLSPAGDMDVPAGRAAELWVIPAGGAPRSLGVIVPGRTQRMTVADDARALFSAGAVLAVSIEPAGGSPSGQPTGPVVAKGEMRAV